MGVSHLLSYLRSHQKKKRTQVSISSGTQNVKKKTDMCVDGSLQKKMKKKTDQHACAHASHNINKSGTRIPSSFCTKPNSTSFKSFAFLMLGDLYS